MSKAIKLRNKDKEYIYPCPYFPIGSIYLSINEIDPSIYFGGTWEQIKDDAYLKIVSSNPGKLDGTSSEHKIPVGSIPSHKHSLLGLISSTGNTSQAIRMAAYYGPYGNMSGVNGDSIGSSGGGQSYYPYYLGIYLWVRIA